MYARIAAFYLAFTNAMVWPDYDMVVVYTAWNENPGPGLRTKDAIERVVTMVADKTK